MADQAAWFKLWCAALDDPDLDNLDIADFGRWAKLGAFVKRHGTAGTILIRPPARSLCTAFQVATFNDVRLVLHRLPGLILEPVTDVTAVSVTFRNWRKYQGDNSLDRVRRFRARVTPQKRREEKREEEKRTEERRGEEKPPARRVVLPDDAFLQALRENPAYQHLDLDRELGKMDAYFLTPKGRGRQKTRGFIVAWLNRCDRPVSGAALPPAAPTLTTRKTAGNAAVFARALERPELTPP